MIVLVDDLADLMLPAPAAGPLRTTELDAGSSHRQPYGGARPATTQFWILMDRPYLGSTSSGGYDFHWREEIDAEAFGALVLGFDNQPEQLGHADSSPSRRPRSGFPTQLSGRGVGGAVFHAPAGITRAFRVGGPGLEPGTSCL